jgi:hypothetical protein
MMSDQICGHGSCENIPGNFRCICQDGYESSFMMESCSGKFYN